VINYALFACFAISCNALIESGPGCALFGKPQSTQQDMLFLINQINDCNHAQVLSFSLK
jgi:hypothetical protein